MPAPAVLEFYSVMPDPVLFIGFVLIAGKKCLIWRWASNNEKIISEPLLWSDQLMQKGFPNPNLQRAEYKINALFPQKFVDKLARDLSSSI
jgi:hypothetical protein